VGDQTLQATMVGAARLSMNDSLLGSTGSTSDKASTSGAKEPALSAGPGLAASSALLDDDPVVAWLSSEVHARVPYDEACSELKALQERGVAREPHPFLLRLVRGAGGNGVSLHDAIRAFCMALAREPFKYVKMLAYVESFPEFIELQGRQVLRALPPREDASQEEKLLHDWVELKRPRLHTPVDEARLRLVEAELKRRGIDPEKERPTFKGMRHNHALQSESKQPEVASTSSGGTKPVRRKAASESLTEFRQRRVVHLHGRRGAFLEGDIFVHVEVRCAIARAPDACDSLRRLLFLTHSRTGRRSLQSRRPCRRNDGPLCGPVSIGQVSRWSAALASNPRSPR
jgi:hypothetical protein